MMLHQHILYIYLFFCLGHTVPSCNETDRSGTSDAIETSAANTGINVYPGDSVQNSNRATDIQDQSEWPCFHGADRQNKSNETGLLKTWPDDGPELLWSVAGLGEGYSSVSVADGLIFTSGTFNDQTYVFAYDLDGELVWKKPNGSAWKVEVYWARGYDGPRSTPTYDDGVVYHLSELNRLTAYQSETGDMIWSRDLMGDFITGMPDYGYTESVLIDGNMLYVKPAGRMGFQVCLNKKTGETIWVNNDIPGLYAYNSAVLHEFGGYRQLINASSSCYYGVDPKTGKLLWKFDFENEYEVNCSDAVAHNEYVFMSSGEGGGCVLVRLKSSGKNITAEKVWKTDLMDNYHGGVIYHDGYVYGSGDRSRGWICIELLTGKLMWKDSGRMGSLTFADGMLYLYDENGRMRLVKASPEQFEVRGEFRVPRGGVGPYWAHPVVCGGRLYLRHADALYAYNISNG